MKKKYYYNCPIQALYMHIEFGVKFDTEIKLSVDLSNDNYLKNMTPAITKIYVAPESEHIFEPKKGDLGIERNLHTLEPCFSGGTYWFYDNDYLEIKPHPQKVDIIYRNNKHFFNPKEEN